MAEIEIKVLGIDPEAVKARLHELGARKIFTGIVRCVHFDREPFLRDQGELFRLRRWEGEGDFPDKFEICYKGPKTIVDGCKVRDEIETVVGDADRFETIMHHLGYRITLNNEKRRESYEFVDIHIDIDAYPGVPVYMEIEGSSPEMIGEALQELQLTTYERSTESADELFTRLWPKVDFDWLKL